MNAAEPASAAGVRVSLRVGLAVEGSPSLMRMVPAGRVFVSDGAAAASDGSNRHKVIAVMGKRDDGDVLVDQAFITAITLSITVIPPWIYEMDSSR